MTLQLSFIFNRNTKLQFSQDDMFHRMILNCDESLNVIKEELSFIQLICVWWWPSVLSHQYFLSVQFPPRNISWHNSGQAQPGLTVTQPDTGNIPVKFRVTSDQSEHSGGLTWPPVRVTTDQSQHRPSVTWLLSCLCCWCSPTRVCHFNKPLIFLQILKTESYINHFLVESDSYLCFFLLFWLWNDLYKTVSSSPFLKLQKVPIS